MYVMKRFSLLLCLLVITLAVSAQRSDRYGRTNFGIGPAIGFATSNPLKDLPGNKGWGLGAGGMVQVEHFFRGSFSGVIQSGFISFAGRSAGSNHKNKAYTTVPVRVGANGYLGNLHLGAQIGVGLNSKSGASATSFAYSPQIGYNFSRNDLPLDFTVSYDGYAGNGGFSAILFKLSLIL